MKKLCRKRNYVGAHFSTFTLLKNNIYFLSRTFNKAYNNFSISRLYFIFNQNLYFIFRAKIKITFILKYEQKKSKVTLDYL